MESRFKLRISRMFKSSFGSCRTRNISDVVEKPIFSPHHHNNMVMIEPPLPPPSSTASASSSSPILKARRPPFPSICKPRYPESSQGRCKGDNINHDCMIMISTPRETLPRRKVSARYPPLIMSAAAAPPASPILPFGLFSDCKDDFGFYQKKKSLARDKKKKKKKKKKNNKQRAHVKSKNATSNANTTTLSSSTTTFFSSSSQESGNNYIHSHGGGGWWLSSEDETETLFSSRTLSSSDSSAPSAESLHRQRSSHRRRCSRRRRQATSGGGRGRFDINNGVDLPLEGGGSKNNNNNKQNYCYSSSNSKVKDSFAVVKSSSDPYNDFRTSMVEMIVERQIFAAKDLEQLLQWFLSLNSPHHHPIIVEVFTEIWDTLFSNSS